MDCRNEITFEKRFMAFHHHTIFIGYWSLNDNGNGRIGTFDLAYLRTADTGNNKEFLPNTNLEWKALEQKKKKQFGLNVLMINGKVNNKTTARAAQKKAETTR